MLGRLLIARHAGSVLIIVVALATVGQFGAGAGVASAAGSSYVTAVPVCKSPTSRQKQDTYATCFSMRLVPATAGTAGAVPRRAVPSSYQAGPVGGYTPADLAAAYGVNTDLSTSVTVAIVSAFSDPNALADLNVFDANYGLPAETSTSLRIVNQSGATSPLPSANSHWGLEISLDLDAVRGLCHKCKIILVEASDNSMNNLAIAANEAYTLGARVISNSYGVPESGAIPASTLSAYDHPGAVILAATGDDGMYSWDVVNPTHSGTSANAPNVPSSLATVVAVGGTTLYLSLSGQRSEENAWNDNGPYDYYGWETKASLGATGGGCSTQVTAPRWQSFVTGYSATNCGGKRLAADIAVVADPFTGYDTYDSYVAPGWQTVGGTSLSSPLIAAMWALAGGAGGVDYPALSLYGHFKSDAAHPFNDVIVGGNGVCDNTTRDACQTFWGSPPNTFGFGTIDCAWQPLSASSTGDNILGCDAEPGFDGPSGVGTPIGLTPFKPMTPTPVIKKPTTITHGISAAFSGTSSTDPFPGGSIAHYLWKFGDGSATSSAASPSHTYAKAGTYTLKLTVTDNYNRSKSKSVSITVK